ncbi:MAG: asparagine synthetase B [Candidatus Methanoperedens sp.]|nr:asparagine synthetase B [Candidatus Methanoperedens sp.]
MVGLAGVVSTDNKEIDIEKLSSLMCQVIKHEERHKTELYISNGIGMGRVHLGILNPEPQPMFSKDRSIWIMMDGEIYDTQDIKTELISKGHIFSIDNDPELILHLYEELGNDFVDKLNGSFSLAIWNEKSQKLLIANDRYGSRPIYYTNSNGYLLFGSEIKVILQDETFKKRVDDRSVTEFFSFGHILGNKTFFYGIELLPPASIMTFDRRNVSIDKYWDLEFNTKYENHTEDYYIEKLYNLVLQSVERRMKGKKRIGVMLSGGLDSRTIVASIQRKHYPFDTFTHGEPDCNDLIGLLITFELWNRKFID